MLSFDGCSKSEYVIYKLKEMGKIAQKDIMQISNQFDRLDNSNCGKITVADLMENDWVQAQGSACGMKTDGDDDQICPSKKPLALQESTISCHPVID